MGKRVLVTGSSGMLGSFLCPKLRKQSWVGELITPDHHACDLRDQQATRRLFEQERPDIVIHLAGNVGGIGYARAHPGNFFYDNAIMGIHVLESARLTGIEKFVGMGSVCAYPEFAPIPLQEKTLWDGYPQEVNAPYGIAKKALLVMSQAYRQQYELNAIHLLLVNLYGPGDKFDLERSHVIGALIRKFSDAARDGMPSVTLWGDGSPTREFLYAQDAAQAVLLATERYDGADPINIGSGQEISVKDLAKVIAAEVGFTGEISWDRNKPNGQPRRCLDTRKAAELFGFQAHTPLEEGIARTVAWFRENRERIA
ncbi:GDP-fucose synthetase [Candidatus Peregrinibacteria bacterium CG10_big_fil_rev_8_21_14_0_10_55_24]|nr:MAG: GDP-fucose synthetase [Candidatus Peregrinibacteria bacterium CG10_big_fil_rev_8_21_14_0_10_55_24]